MRQGKRRRRTWEEDPEPEETEELDSVVQEFRDGVHDLHRSLRRAAALEWLRLKARAVDGTIQGVLYFFIAAFFLAIFCSGGVFIALEIRDSLGNLVAGFTLLGVVLLGGVIFRSVARGRTLRKARRAYDDDEEEEDDFDGRNDS